MVVRFAAVRIFCSLVMEYVSATEAANSAFVAGGRKDRMATASIPTNPSPTYYK